MIITLGATVAHGRLDRLPGGFWTYPGCGTRHRGVPMWYASTTTIRALIHHGLLATTRGGQGHRTNPAVEPTVQGRELWEGSLRNDAIVTPDEARRRGLP